MRAHSFSMAIAVAAAVLAFQPGLVQAQTTVPQSGAAQGVNPPGSLPGGNAAFGASSTASPTPLAGAPASGAAQGVTNPAPGGQQTGTVSTTTVR